MAGMAPCLERNSSLRNSRPWEFPLALLSPDPIFQTMDYDEDKVDDAVLALLHLTTFTHSGFPRAWKGQSWEAMERLHKKGYISDPVGKAKSVGLSEVGKRRSEELFAQLFGRVS